MRDNRSWAIGSRCYGVGDQEWFHVVDDSSRVVFTITPRQDETDEETGRACSGAADFGAIPDVCLMLAAPELLTALVRLHAASNQYAETLDCWLCGSLAGQPHDAECAVAVAARAIARANGAA